ncbi:methyltransferase domain-containing protein [Kineosporia sp. J2-2]|uniref:Methyltransferase domain-containing protein n=1 Tax=Kineosporia corallincola TaxID=2835133 RepID=A0ABS5TCQ9_9ACTN|nr:methyltransferase domain-containing protein [Kineosporia corallincola]MBT0768874.1 methyltransferase domain-containing protein [Kineosporia corallincola]
MTAPDLRTAGYRDAGPEESARAGRSWWDENAAEYQLEHAGDLTGRLVWGPELLDEADAGLLGAVAGRDVLEVGAGSADSSAWLKSQGARAVATDISAGMLRAHDAAPTAATSPTALPARVVADARVLPFANDSFDIVFTAYGALPFVADPERVHAEVSRVLRPGGRWVFSVTHPVRWAFPDDGGEGGLTVRRPYFDRTPYVETDDRGVVSYSEHHRTIGDRVRELATAGFRLVDLVEPEWPDGVDRVWGSWSPLRGRLIPGTAIFVAVLEHPTKL